MCRNSSTTITDEPHLCMPRTSQPSVASFVMNAIVFQAVAGSGW
jgi:hypothetical protein